MVFAQSQTLNNLQITKLSDCDTNLELQKKQDSLKSCTVQTNFKFSFGFSAFWVDWKHQLARSPL